MIGTILGIIFFIIIIAVCCSSDSSSTSSTYTPKKTSNRPPRRNVSYCDYSYSECPSCGAPYFDGYCEECGYPDINQGWIGENY